MGKYILGESINQTFNASSKARDDVNYFVQKNGYTMIANNDKRMAKSNIGKIIATQSALLQLIVKLKKSDILFVQTSLKVLPCITFIKKFKNIKIIYLIHDLDAVRDNYDNKELVDKEINILKDVDYIIAHNDKMVSFLNNFKLKSRVFSLGIFDYYLPTYKNKSIKDSFNHYTVVFAGNLDPQKTGFIYKLDNISKNFDLNLYGNTNYRFKTINYCGKYPPEKLPEVMDGDFGLVWEGNEFCMDETNHPYIMLNNPHKVSLYIVSGLPIIIWEKAALAEFVINNNVGIVIKNISEIDQKLKEISYEKYKLMIDNINNIRGKLIEGNHIKTVLSEIEEHLFGSIEN